MHSNKVLIYEGIPGSGKTTLRYAFGRKTQFRNITIDRFTPTQWVYSKLRGETIDLDNLTLIETLLSPHSILIYCSISIDQALSRAKIKGDDIDTSLEDLTKAQTLYEKYLKQTNFQNIIDLNTDSSIDTTVLSLMRKLREFDA